MATLPDTGFLRLIDIIGRPAKQEADPPQPRIPGLIPVCKSTWWAGVRTGRFPKPIKAFGGRIAVWRVEDIRALIKGDDVGAGR